VTWARNAKPQGQEEVVVVVVVVMEALLRWKWIKCRRSLPLTLR
jgi:hypothetical protein